MSVIATGWRSSFVVRVVDDVRLDNIFCRAESSSLISVSNVVVAAAGAGAGFGRAHPHKSELEVVFDVCLLPVPICSVRWVMRPVQVCCWLSVLFCVPMSKFRRNKPWKCTQCSDNSSVLSSLLVETSLVATRPYDLCDITPSGHKRIQRSIHQVDWLAVSDFRANYGRVS